MDDDALDAAFEHGAGRGARLSATCACGRYNPYTGELRLPSFWPKTCARPIFRRRTKTFRLDGYEAGGKNVPFRVDGRVRGQGPGRHPLRAAAPVDRARRRCVPRHHRRLRDDRGRYRHRAYRADVRCRRRPGGQAERHPAAGGRRSQRASANRWSTARASSSVLEDLDPEFVRTHVDAAAYGEFAGRFVKNAYDPTLSEADPTLDVDLCMKLQVRGQGVPHREAYAQLSPLLAYRQACAVLSARLVVHPHDGRQGPPDRAEPYDRLEARKYRLRAASASGSKTSSTGTFRARATGELRCRSGLRRITAS